MFNRLYRAILSAAAWLIAEKYLHNPSYRKRIESLYGVSALAFLADAGNHLAYLLGRKTMPFAPRSVVFEISTVCNLRCGMCPQPTSMRRKKEFMDIALFRSVLDANPQLVRVGLCNWGEPTLHPQLPAFLEAARKKGLFTTLITNAARLDPALSTGMLDAGLSHICFSLDGTGEVYEKIRGVPYETVRRNILAFLDINRNRPKPCFTEINCVTSTLNEAHLDEIMAELKTYPVDNINMQSQQVYDPAAQAKRTHPKCWELYRSGTILVNGDIVPCCADYDGTLKIGNMRDDPRIMRHLNGDRMRLLRQTDLASATAPPMCRSCVEYAPKYSGKRFSRG